MYSTIQPFNPLILDIEHCRNPMNSLAEYSVEAVHQSLVHSWIEKPEVIGIFMAPPCGTSSVAREIPIPGDANAPCPLRSLRLVVSVRC